MKNCSNIAIIINYIIQQYIKIANYNFLPLPYIVITNIVNININNSFYKNREANTHFLSLYYMLISIQLAQSYAASLLVYVRGCTYSTLLYII